MAPTSDLRESILGAWRTTARMSEFLVERLPQELWVVRAPGQRRTVRSIAGHLNNARSRWIKTLGLEHGIAVPPLVDLHRVTRRQLVVALRRSSRGIEALLQLGLDNGGQVPPSRRYVWRNLPLDVPHVLAYFVAHEAHHRGQLLEIARQSGHPLPSETTNGLWMWTKGARSWVAAAPGSAGRSPTDRPRTAAPPRRGTAPPAVARPRRPR